MINATIEAIRTALHKEFGDAYAVISEGGMQDLKGPCFFISCKHTAFKQMAGRKYFRKNQYFIRHVPEPGHARTGCYAAAERMFSCLEYVAVSDALLHGTSMECEMEEGGTLLFYVNYDFFTQKRQEETCMETAEIRNQVKE